MVHAGAPALSVDVRELQAQRLERARLALRTNDMAAALLFDPANIRYATCDGQYLVANLHCAYRWALVLADSAPVLWDSADQLPLSQERWGGDVRRATGFAFFGAGPDTAERAATAAGEILDVLAERGLSGERLGVDRADAVMYVALADRGVQIRDATPVLETARSVKTPLELDIHRDNARLVDESVTRFLEQLRPGLTENELWAVLARETFAHGALHTEARLLSSGPRTNPWMQEATDRVVEDGDFVAFDTDLVGPHGYLTDMSRTYLCGDRRPTEEQRQVYSAAYEFVQDAIPEFRAGRSMAELGQLLGARIPARYLEQRYPFIAHGCGAADEYPVVTVDNHHDGVLEPGMVMSVEAYMGAVGGHAGAKYEEQIIITDAAPELITHAPGETRLQ